MTEEFTIRHVQESDLVDIVSILNVYITNTAITFDSQPYTAKTRFSWFNSFNDTGRHQCLVAESNGRVIAYANSGYFKPKAAYDTSVEVSIYKSSQIKSKGIGTALYDKLFQNLKKEDLHRAYAYITLPNEASIYLHRKFGFHEVGILNSAGRKFDNFHSVQLMEKDLTI